MAKTITFPHPLIRIKDVNGMPVFGFEHEAISIHKPYESVCGRFRVSPAVYGLTEIQAGWLTQLNNAIRHATRIATREGALAIESVLGRAHPIFPEKHFESHTSQYGVAMGMADFLESKMTLNGFVFAAKEHPAAPRSQTTVPTLTS